MKKIDIKAHNHRAFTAFEGETVMGTLVYPKWYSEKAEITLDKDTVFKVVAKSFWKATQQVFRDKEVFLDIKANWKGGYVITKPGDPERPYIFKAKGWFNNGYLLTNYKDEVLLEITLNFSWKKIAQDYAAICYENFGSEELDRVLLLLSAHFFRTMQNAAAAGTV